MAWSTPLTAVSNSTLTAAQWNASVRDNLLETAPAKATTAGRIFVSTGANAIAERAISSHTVTTSNTTTSSSYADLGVGGPTVTVTTGTRALVFLTVWTENTSTFHNWAAVDVSGASTIAANDSDAMVYQTFAGNADHRGATVIMYSSLTAGSNTFTAKYRTDGGTATYKDRHLVVIAL